jgi:hypothetical protein
LADRSTPPEKTSGSLRDLARWLLLAPLILAITFGCGQLALLGVSRPAQVDVGSRLLADYRPWPFNVIQPINSSIIADINHDHSINTTLVPGSLWPTAQPQSTPIPNGTPIAQAATRTPTPTSTAVTASPTATATPTSRPSPTVTPLPSRTPALIPTATPTSTDTATPENTNPPPPTKRPKSTPTATGTSTTSPTDTNTPTPTATATASSTPTPTSTSTQTPTPSSTPTATPPLCTGTVTAPNEPNIGPPNGEWREIPCGGYFDIDLNGVSSYITSTLVYYERAVPTCGGVCLDWVKIDVCTDNPCVQWTTVFNWGDDIPDYNTNVYSYTVGGELDNEPIPASALLLGTGITINVDDPTLPPVPLGGYRYIRIWSPINWPDNDGAEVDAIQVLP